MAQGRESREGASRYLDDAGRRPGGQKGAWRERVWEYREREQTGSQIRFNGDECNADGHGV